MIPRGHFTWLGANEPLECSIFQLDGTKLFILGIFCNVVHVLALQAADYINP